MFNIPNALSANLPQTLGIAKARCQFCSSCTHVSVLGPSIVRIVLEITGYMLTVRFFVANDGSSWLVGGVNGLAMSRATGIMKQVIALED